MLQQILWRALLSLSLLAGGLAWVQPAMACGTCSSGDPTLAALGTESPRADGVRLGLSLGYRTETSGARGVDAIELREYRAELSAAWAPVDSLFLMAVVPLLERRTTDVTLATRSTRGLGDIELRSKLIVYRDRAFAPRYLLGAVLGLQLPTAPFLHDAAGQPLPFEAQAGTGALAGVLGWAHNLRLGPWSAFSGVDVRVPLSTRERMKPGAALRGTLALQRALAAAWSVRAALDALLEGRSVEDGVRARDSGGVVAFVGGDVLVDVGADFSVLLGARQPVLEARNGDQSVGPLVNLTLTRDW